MRGRTVHLRPIGTVLANEPKAMSIWNLLKTSFQVLPALQGTRLRLGRQPVSGMFVGKRSTLCQKRLLLRGLAAAHRRGVCHGGSIASPLDCA